MFLVMQDFDFAQIQSNLSKSNHFFLNLASNFSKSNQCCPKNFFCTSCSNGTVCCHVILATCCHVILATSYSKIIVNDQRQKYNE